MDRIQRDILLAQHRKAEDWLAQLGKDFDRKWNVHAERVGRAYFKTSERRTLWDGKLALPVTLETDPPTAELLAFVRKQGRLQAAHEQYLTSWYEWLPNGRLAYLIDCGCRAGPMGVTCSDDAQCLLVKHANLQLLTREIDIASV